MLLSSALRFAGLLLLVVAAYRLGDSIQQAVASGTVLLNDPRPSLPGRRGLQFPVPWQEAWSYFCGWLLLGMSGLILVLQKRAAVGRIIIAGTCLLVSFVMIASATMFDTVSGLVAWLAVFSIAVVLAVAYAIWQSQREHQRVSIQPEINDRLNKHNDA